MTPFAVAGQTLRYERISLKVSLRAFAASVGLSPTALYGIEKGTFRPSVDAASKIIAALNAHQSQNERMIVSWMAPDAAAVADWKDILRLSSVSSQ